MATLEQIIKDLQEIADSGQTGGNSSGRRKAAEESKRLLELAKKINKSDDESLKQKQRLLEQARNQFKIGEKQYDQIDKQVKSTEKLIEKNKD